MLFTAVDTGYMITHIGELYDSVHCTFIYQTVNGGAYWEIVDSVPNFSFRKYSHTTLGNVVYGYMDNGTANNEEYWNTYLCMIDLENHRHKVRDDAIYGPGDIFLYNDSLHFPVYMEGNRYLFRLNAELNDIFCISDTLPKNIKDISYNDSQLVILTYDDKIYYFKYGQLRVHQIDESCNGILLVGGDCYVSYWGTTEHDAGIIRSTNQFVSHEKLSFPSGYKVVEFLKSKNDSVIITCSKEDIATFPTDIVFSMDKGQTWEKVHLQDPIVFPEHNSCFCAPYLFIKSTFDDEIYKICLK